MAIQTLITGQQEQELRQPAEPAEPGPGSRTASAHHHAGPPPSDAGSCGGESELESWLDEAQTSEPCAAAPELAPSTEETAGGAHAVPTHAALRASPHYPVLVTADAVPGVTMRASDTQEPSLPINSGRWGRRARRRVV